MVSLEVAILGGIRLWLKSVRDTTGSAWLMMSKIFVEHVINAKELTGSKF